MSDNFDIEKEFILLKSSIEKLNARLEKIEEFVFKSSPIPEKKDAPINLANRLISPDNLIIEKVKPPIPKPFILPKWEFPKINLINLFGALTVIFAIAIFFKISVDKGWIGPILRVLLGYIFGLGALGIGEYCQNKNYKKATIGFIGLGQVVLFLTTWFAQYSFHLINWPIAFICFLSITALVVAQALRYNSQAIAVFGIIGGFLVPILASSNDRDFILIGAYYFILTLGILFIAYQKNWKILKWLSLSTNYLFLFIWSIILINSNSHQTISHNPSFQLANYLLFLAGFFILYTAIACYRAIKRAEQLDVFDLCLLIATGIFSVLLSLIALKGQYLIYLGIVCILVAFVYLFLCRLLISKESLNKRDFNVFLSLSVAFLTLAIRLIVPVKFVSITWALEAILLAWLSDKKELNFLRFNYSCILVIIALRLLIADNILSSAYSFQEHKYYPFNLTTISGLASIGAFFYCLKKYQTTNIELELEKIKQNSISTLVLWSSILIFSLLVFSREFYGLAESLFPSSSFSHVVHIGLLVLFGNIMFWLFCKTQLKEQNRPKLILISAFWVILLLISNNIFSHFIYYNQQQIIWAHSMILVLLLLIFNLFTLHKKFKSSSESQLSKLPIIIFSTGVVLSMLIIRREVHLFTYSQADSEANYQISLSVLYSLLALGIYILGLFKKQKDYILISYILFAFVGLKVYFKDLVNLEPILRGLSLLVFGSILLLCSFLEQKFKEIKTERKK